jgi:hypothetical protein
VWPRDGAYAAVTFDRTGHAAESAAFYRWLNNAERPTESWGPGFFYQKYTTDGKPVWRNPQVDETSSVPWGMYYHYLVTGDGAFLSNNWNLAYTSARASSEDSAVNPVFLNYDDATHLIWSWNVWEDKTNEHVYSNGSVVRGLEDAASIGDVVGSNSWATTFRTRATDIKGNGSWGIVKRLNDKVEPSDISHLGLTIPYEVFTPNDPLMTNIVEWLHGRQSAGGFTDDIVEHGGDGDGLLRRYNHKIGGEADTYWNGGPWTLSTAWYGMYFARWQDYVGGKTMVNTNKLMLDKIIAKLGPMGLAAEQIALNAGEQKYPGFWHQAAWPNVWESHSTIVDQMMMFLDYKPLTNNTCYFAPKLPTGWPSLTFNNLPYRTHRLDVTISEGTFETRADINKRTAGALSVDLYLRIPAGNTPTVVITNGSYYVPSPGQYDTATGRVRINVPLLSATGNNVLAVTYGTSDFDGDGLTDSFEVGAGSNPANSDSDGDQMSDGFEYTYFGHPTNGDPNADADGDGQNNVAEALSGTIPTNASSALRVTSVTVNGADVIVSFASVTGKNYRLEWSSAPGGGSWTTVQDNIPGTNGIVPITHVGAAALPQRYYRVWLLQ